MTDPHALAVHYQLTYSGPSGSESGWYRSEQPFKQIRDYELDMFHCSL